MGAVLTQVQEEREKVTSYWSWQLDKAQRKYYTTEWEALAVVSAIKEILHYLYSFHFTVIFDHNPLTSMNGMRDVGSPLARWLLLLQQSDFIVQYWPGSLNSIADALSRRQPMEEHVEGDAYSLDGPALIQQLQEEDLALSNVVKSLKENTQLQPAFARQRDKLFMDQELLRCKFCANSV